MKSKKHQLGNIKVAEGLDISTFRLYNTFASGTFDVNISTKKVLILRKFAQMV